MDATEYSNGPLPGFLSSRAYITSNGREFALPQDAAHEYLRWCAEQGGNVLGLETWRPTVPGPTVLIGVVADGGEDVCREAMSKYVAEFGPEVVFNIWVKVPNSLD